MGKRELRSNYIIAFINLFLFLIFFCIAYTFTKELLTVLRANGTIAMWVLFAGLFSPFIFYTFITDLNGVYEKVQHFFFRSTLLNLIFPSILTLLLIGYFLFPKVFNVSFNKGVFLFLGGFSSTMHLIFAARETRSTSFTGFINYSLGITMIYMLVIIIFGIYLLIGYNYSLKTAFVNGMRSGVSLVKGIILQLFP